MNKNEERNLVAKEKILVLPVYIDDSVYMESRGEILQYVITSINIDKYGKTFHAYCEEAKHKISFPEEWIDERVFLDREEAELDMEKGTKRLDKKIFNAEKQVEAQGSIQRETVKDGLWRE